MSQTTGADDLPATKEEVLEPDEAPTPAWLPLVGLGVLLIALLAFVAARPAAKQTAEVAPGASAAAEPSADPVAAATGRARQPAPAQPSPRLPGRGE
jgi:hypothetical protein